MVRPVAVSFTSPVSAFGIEPSKTEGLVADIWRTRDRLGREVVFNSASRDHIRRRRAELADRLDEIRWAIEAPDLVTRDATYPNRENHYRRTAFGPGWLKVVVRYLPVPPQGTWVGEVITAFPLRSPNPKETRLWP
jgi:hypothetical protein